MDTSELKGWFINNNIEERTVEGFWGYLRNYMEEDIYDFEDTFGQHFDMRLVKVKPDKIQLTHIFDNGDFIYSILRVDYIEDYIGQYKLVFNMDGSIEDDLLKLEPSSFVRKLSDEANRSAEIAKAAFHEGLSSEIIARITGLDLDYIDELRNEFQEANNKA